MIATLRTIGKTLILFAIVTLGASAQPAPAQPSVDPFAKEFQAKQAEIDPFALEFQAPKNEKKEVVPDKKEEKKPDRTALALAKRITFDVAVSPAKAKPGETVRLTLTGKPGKGFYTYPMTVRTPVQGLMKLAKINFQDHAEVKPLWPVNESKPEFANTSGTDIDLKHAKDFTWSQDILILPQASPGKKKLGFTVNLMVCDKDSCVGPGAYPPLEAEIEVEGPAVPLSSELQQRLAAGPPPIKVESPPANMQALAQGKDTEGKKPLGPTAIADPKLSKSGDFLGLLGAAFGGAFLMLLTPCVFPMIPITVNFFLKQSEQQHHRPLAVASVYSGTIIILLTLVMLVLGNVVIMLANDPWFNLLLGGLLIVFALSLFGMYEIMLPSGLARFTSSHEGQGGFAGAIFMALTFTITSFTCTGPFLGMMLAPVAGIKPPLWQLFIAAFVYSATFAAPFFFLALFPAMLKKLPKSGGWLNSIKVTMGFLELGAALKFLSNTDIAWNPGNPRLFNYDTVLCAWIALSFACGLYLIGGFRLPHDSPVEHIGVMRMLFATIFFGLAVYLTPALRGERPAGFVGENIVAFLPPSFKEIRGGPSPGGEQHLAWHLDYQDAWKEATKTNKLIFIDFTGVNCTNCRDNEKNVFPKPDVVAGLKEYVRVQLYTDTVPNTRLSPSEAKEQADRNSMWRDALGDPTNPYYIIFRPDPAEPFDGEKLKGLVVGRRNGTIRDIPDFVQFLQEPLQNQAAVVGGGG